MNLKPIEKKTTYSLIKLGCGTYPIILLPNQGMERDKSTEIPHLLNTLNYNKAPRKIKFDRFITSSNPRQNHP